MRRKRKRPDESAEEWALYNKLMDVTERQGVLADALLRACLYLDGFVWVTEPEASELDAIKVTAASALGCETWEQAVELSQLHTARTGLTG